MTSGQQPRKAHSGCRWDTEASQRRSGKGPSSAAWVESGCPLWDSQRRGKMAFASFTYPQLAIPLKSLRSAKRESSWSC